MEKKGMITLFTGLSLLTLTAFPQPASAVKKQGTIKVAYMTTVRDKKGNYLKKYRGKSADQLFIAKAKTVNYYGIRYVKSGKRIRTYYDIGHGGYVPADSAILINGKPAIALNSNSYVYNSKLKRTGKKYKVYQPLTYAGKIKYSNKKYKWYYYTRNVKKNPYAIPKVYKKKYLKIGKNRYIKAVNVFSIRRKRLFVKGPITATVKKNMYSFDSRLYETNHLYKKGQKVKLDKCISSGSVDHTFFYYRVAKTHEYLPWNGTDYWADTYEDSTLFDKDSMLKIKQPMGTDNYFLPGKTKYVISKENVKKLQTYDLTGTVIKGKTVPNLYVHVDGQAYLLNPKTKKIELFYHLQDQYLIGEFFPFETANPRRAVIAADQYNGFLKASEVTKAKLPIIISKKAAKASNKRASASQKAALKKEIAKAKAVQKKMVYKLSSSYRRDYLDYALSNAKKATTKSEVTLAKWLLVNSRVYLNGKKAPVTNVNKLSNVEYRRVWRIVIDATPNGYTPDVYYKQADGTWHSLGPTVTLNKTCRFVYVNTKTHKKKFLKVSDFAENK